MVEKAILVRNLSKEYRIGLQKSLSLRESFVRNFTPSYEKKSRFWALQDLNFEINQGEALGVIGRNGAGKSTLLKILSRITEPTKGRIEINGRLASLLEVGTGFHPELTGRENIFLNGTILGMRRQEVRNKIEEIVEFSGVEKFLDTPVKRYSSGMYVRLAFAVAAHLDSEVLLVDEVLAVGDIEFQRKCLSKMGEIAGVGRTVILVSHNMASINSLCSTGIFLNAGKIESAGSIKEVVAHYLSSNREQEQSNLSERTDRVGNGHLRITDISIVNSKGLKTNSIYQMESFKVQLSYLIENKLADFTGCHFSIGIFDMFENIMISHQNLLVGKLFSSSEIRTSNTVTFSTKGVALKDGRYTISVDCVMGGEFIDRIEQATFLEILPSHFYNYERTFPKGLFGLEATWNIGEA